MGLTLDTGAFIALERRKRRAWRFVELAAADDLALRAPSAVLVELWRGSPRSKAVSKLIDSGIEWIDTTPRLAMRAGEALRDHAGEASVVDALVATVAAVFGDIVLTSDVGDFTQLGEHFKGLRVLAV